MLIPRICRAPGPWLTCVAIAMLWPSFVGCSDASRTRPATPPFGPRNADETFIDGDTYHPLGEDLVAIERTPAGASADAPVPGCLLVHGSGGLFREGEPGASCTEALENRYEELVSLLVANGVAVVAPSSFYSRDERFCEDNDDDYFRFAPSPFFPSASAPRRRDDAYKMRRIAIRALDALAAMRYLADRADVDASRLCMVGTSNGGTTIMSYVPRALERHLVEYLGDSPRDYETSANADYEERMEALRGFPAAPPDLAALTIARPRPRFAQVIAPGCGLRGLIPNIESNEALVNEDLFYPDATTDLVLELGTQDDVVDACAEAVGDGLRERQARFIESDEALATSRYRVHLHDAGHDLLDDATAGDAIRARLLELVGAHF